MLTTLLYVSTAIITLYVFLDLSWRVWTRKFSFLPSAPTIPWLGSTPFLGSGSRDFYKAVTSFAKKYDHLYVLWLGPKPIIHCGRVEYIQTLLRSKDLLTKSSSSYEILHEWLGYGLLTSTGEQWKKRRMALTGAFHFTVLNDFMETYDHHARKMANRMHTLSNSGKPVDVQALMTLGTLDVICETAMGVKINALETSDLDGTPNSEYVRTVQETKALMIQRMINPLLRSKFVYQLTPSGKAFYQCVNILHNFTLDVIKRNINYRKSLRSDESPERLSLCCPSVEHGKETLTADPDHEAPSIKRVGDTSAAEVSRDISAELAGETSSVKLAGETPSINSVGETPSAELAKETPSVNNSQQLYNTNRKKKIFLDVLLDLHEKGEIDMDGIREEVDTFMHAGHDTIATAITFTLYEIGRHPEIQERLHQEIDKISKMQYPLKEKIGELKYLENVVKESLRFHPPVVDFGREIEQDVKIGDDVIPAGSEIFIEPFSVHMNERYWDEPHIFNPDRFENKDFQRRNPYIYVPFSAGPRNCIGQKFAMREVKVFLFTILSDFRINSVQAPDELEICFDIILHSANGVNIEFYTR